MKKLFFTLLMLVPMTIWAQDNTWERPEVDEQEEAAKAKENPDAKYLKGAVPEVNGKVVFTKHINAPGKSAAQIYDILHQYLQKMVKEKKVTTIHGTELDLDCQSVCVHGDNEKALAFVKRIREAFAAEGIGIAPLREIV